MSASTNLWVLLGLGVAGICLMAQRLRSKKPIKPDFGAFLEKFELLPPPQPAPPKAPHPLTGLTFAVADVFDIDGYVTGFGNPDWERTHEAAGRTSPVLSVLIDGGATCVGKTVVDEMAYGVTGDNKHFGTPTNPASPERIAGGSSSGSAVAVAAGLVDFSLGIDTTGGIRVPAGFCGILGFRPSHGAVSNIGIIPVAPSLDTTGWFTKDPSILRRVGHVLLQLPHSGIRQPRQIMIADDCFKLSKSSMSRVTEVVIKSTEKLFGKQVLSHMDLGDYLASKVPSLQLLHSWKPKLSSLALLANAMDLLHRHEFKSNHEEWIKSTQPVLDSFISTHMDISLESQNAQLERCQIARAESRLALNALLKDDGILVMPTVCGPPPKHGANEILSENYQGSVFSLMAIASMSGCCQVTVPLGFHDKCPVSVSFIARHGGDRFLLDTVHTMYASIQEQVEIVAKSSLTSSTITQEESAEIAKEKGNIAYKDKHYQKAINLYTEAIKLSGKNATYYSNRAAAYMELLSFQQAETDCSTAISLDKKNVKAYLRRGTAREMLGFYKDAIDDFKHALVLEPTNKTANVALNRLNKLFQ